MEENKKGSFSTDLIIGEMELLEIPIDHIVVYANQPREEFNEEELNGLADSISEVGLQNAITVRRILDRPLYYELVDGERRFRACQICGLTSISALVKNISSEDEQYVSSVVSNFCRSGHTPLGNS